MDVLPFKAIEANYSLTLGDGSQRVQLDGGPGRYRAGLYDMPHTVTATYLVIGQEYDLLMGFWRRMRALGGGPFLVDLIIDGSDAAQYTAYFIPQTASPSEVGGNIRTVSFQMEVQALPDLDGGAGDYWAAVSLMQSAYSDASGVIFGLLNKLVNQDLPHD